MMDKHFLVCKSGMSCRGAGVSLPSGGVAAAAAPSAGCAAGAAAASGAAAAAGAAAGGAGGGRVTPCAARTCTHASINHHAFARNPHTVQGASISAEQHAACCEQVRMPKSGDMQAVTSCINVSLQRLAMPVATDCKLRAFC